MVTTVTWLTLLDKLFDGSGRSEFIVIIDVLADVSLPALTFGNNV